MGERRFDHRHESACSFANRRPVPKARPEPMRAQRLYAEFFECNFDSVMHGEQALPRRPCGTRGRCHRVSRCARRAVESRGIRQSSESGELRCSRFALHDARRGWYQICAASRSISSHHVARNALRPTAPPSCTTNSNISLTTGVAVGAVSTEALVTDNRV